MKRIIIIGGPRTGKTQLAKKLSQELGIPTILCTDPQSLGGDAPSHAELTNRDERWSAVSEDVSHWFDRTGPWIIEGVAAIRALRKYRKTNPGSPPPCDKLLVLSIPKVPQTKAQHTLAVGIHTVLAGIASWAHDVIEDGEPHCNK